MKITGFTAVIVGFVLAVAIIVIANFVFHVPEGAGRLGVFALAAAVFCLFAFVIGNRGGNLNDKAGQ